MMTMMVIRTTYLSKTHKRLQHGRYHPLRNTVPVPYRDRPCNQNMVHPKTNATYRKKLYLLFYLHNNSFITQQQVWYVCIYPSIILNLTIYHIDSLACDAQWDTETDERGLVWWRVFWSVLWSIIVRTHLIQNLFLTSYNNGIQRIPTPTSNSN